MTLRLSSCGTIFASNDLHGYDLSYCQAPVLARRPLRHPDELRPYRSHGRRREFTEEAGVKGRRANYVRWY